MTIETISYSSLRQNLSSVLDKIENNKNIYQITRKQHSDIVMIAKDDYESMVETLHLLSSSKNAKRLEEALQEANNKEFVKVDL